jgi:polyether ionophore transport system permease protein
VLDDGPARGLREGADAAGGTRLSSSRRSRQRASTAGISSARDSKNATLFALPVRRARWFAERLLLAAASAAAVALAAGVLGWAGAASQGADVSLARMIEAGANCLPVTVLFLGLGALALALAPRAGTTIAYALVGSAFLWETIGGLIEAPAWALDVSPFHHVGLVPAESFQAGGAAAMLAIGALAGLAGARCFDRRDLNAG